MKRNVLLLVLAAIFVFAVVSYAAMEKPVATVKVLQYYKSPVVGIAKEINFSVTNNTNKELKNLKVMITADPPELVDLSVKEIDIASIPAMGVWAPTAPVTVTGRAPSITTDFAEGSVSFTLTQDGKVISKDGAILRIYPAR